ncbi:uncharacterized protein LOC110820782 [Carica papaya]|uniref:uncharacterized protein LOC110820782 n=1 Tax=Carica papaya TaxID=3649 RepID=UPI000B8CC4E7|nr:uncharacterized protein LOC110820782 [Carica papaya]
MSGAMRAWAVAATIGAVEALKDQGICRWNYTIRSLHQHAKNNVVRSFTQVTTFSSSSSSSENLSDVISNQTAKNRSEASMEKVMHLSCWGPSTVRF